MPKTPEQWLEEAAPQDKNTIFKLFFGYAPGVGKTFNMLSEGIRRHSRGEDVVIGVVETHGRAGISELASKLEVVPRRKIQYKGASFEEMDLDAILARSNEFKAKQQAAAEQQSAAEAESTQIMLQLPAIPDPSWPVGADEKAAWTGHRRTGGDSYSYPSPRVR